jgi:hypothetical protein
MGAGREPNPGGGLRLQQWRAIERVMEAAKSCAEVKAIFLKGSLATGRTDQYSDVDFYCLVSDTDLAAFLDKRLDLLRSYRPLLFYSHSDFVGPQIVAVFDDGLHFDLYTVTEQRFPLAGPTRVLYDPHGLLSQYLARQQTHALSPADLIENFNSFTFSLLEFVTAWQRGDRCWAYRLASHLSGHLALALRHRYDPDQGQLGMKRLEPVLPTAIRRVFRHAVSQAASDSSPHAVGTFSRLMASAMRELEAVASWLWIGVSSTSCNGSWSE